MILYQSNAKYNERYKYSFYLVKQENDRTFSINYYSADENEYMLFRYDRNFCEYINNREKTNYYIKIGNL